METPDAAIADVADQKRAIAIKQDAVWLAKLGLGAGPSIATESGSAGTGDGGDNAGFHVHFADYVVIAFGDVQVAFGIEHHFVRGLEGGFGCRPTISCISAL